MTAYALLGIGNAILQVSLNPLLNNVVTNKAFLTSSLTAGQVIKAVSSLVGPEIVLLAVNYFGADKWYYCFPILGFITLLSAVWLMATPIEREKNIVSDKGLSMEDTFALLKDRTILLLFLGIFFIVGVDVATNFISSKLMSIRFGWADEQVKFAPQAHPKRIDINLELIKFVATSTPTMKNIPKNSKRIVRSFNNANVSSIESPLSDTIFFSRSIGVAISQTADSNVIKPSIGKQ